MALDIRFSQVFGERAPDEKIEDGDIISAIEFDHAGDYLATGDREGRLVLFIRDKSQGVKDSVSSSGKTFTRPGASPLPQSNKYEFYTEFQSHEPEFDYLKSLEIEEKINKIRWCRRVNSSQMLLCTNDKTIKLWKISERKVKQFKCGNLARLGYGNTRAALPPMSASLLRLPAVITLRDPVITTTPRRIFANAHAYHINSISLSSDSEHFISADDLRINLWNLELTDTSYTVVDMKPANMDDLKEVITSAEMHPVQCAKFAYATSRGAIRLCDLRVNALCDQAQKVFHEPEDPEKALYSELLSSISDIKFSQCGRYMVSRDYMTLKVWDINMERQPIRTVHIHEHLRPHIYQLYDNDCIFDKFECCFSGDGSHLFTGSYNNVFQIYDRHTGSQVAGMECAKTPPPAKTKTRKMTLARKLHSPRKPQAAEAHAESLDVARKILHLAWHPRDNVLAMGAASSLYLFATPPRT
eukprot:TRINITY_DN1125_c0_g1::TRINITY_DN1125_c0_g1_i1::g.17280::m.17280 TRINITY_DN1125_c0_g1::TRINITY_DN1125_c0_g1_i1::g.17280  ORF type:complete len:471 (-),score=77.43,sp/Q39247/2ABB_ARATH/48.38/2e-163,WD40/PF00400.27/5,WD40/PF00400.27/2.4,WD40/PF00400.27/1.3,WD40/PF00400.27/3.5,WD40/PF00400.27/0.89,WD40/PF00400.27/1.1e+02,DUF693/PF05113.8/0.062 TRINITY_DN1125_c0_g1_i1:633-2045(-)